MEASQVRLDVLTWRPLSPVEDAYFRRSFDLAYLIGQLRRLGPVDLVRKVISRRAERGRNDRWVVAGEGVVSAVGGALSGALVGQSVRFVAPCHPPGMERVVLDVRLCSFSHDETPLSLPRQVSLLPRPSEVGPGTADLIEEIAGWHPSSEHSLPNLEQIWQLGAALAPDDGIARQAGSRRQSVRGSATASRKPRLLVVGYGNYAKTVAVPQLSRYLVTVGICDLDPFQLPKSRRGLLVCTDWRNIDPADVDVVLSAGYHHTHVEVAQWALAHDKDVIIEKPIFTNKAQAAELETAVHASNGRAFFGFQRRFLAFNSFVERDLGPLSKSPRDYHCVVFEEPLPDRHWYRWPVSGGRLLSNGCHWIDHFLYLNGGCALEGLSVTDLGRERYCVTAQLRNGAVMTLVLTSEGSPRLGMRDSIEVRAGDRTAYIQDSSRYKSESRNRSLRRVARRPLHAHRAMYDDFGRKIVEGSDADPLALTLQSGLATVAASAQLYGPRFRSVGDRDDEVG